jgi:SSS family solute:Na+ symporter
MGLELQLHAIDVAIIIGFLVAVVAVGLWMSRREQSSEDYFLAGRGLNWWLIGFSLIAANISAEQFVGMSGQAAKASIGLAVASYEWIAAVTLVAVAFLFLPRFLSSGIYTIPEYLEYRFTHSARTIMSLLMVVIYVGVTIATVIYLGAKALDPLLGGQVAGVPINITTLSWAVGIAAAIYVAAGGLAACAWADLIQGSALILGGAVIMVLALMALADPSQFDGTSVAAVQKTLGLPASATLAEKFAVLKSQQMHMVLPRTSDFLPWTALLLGIWIPNLYYWGLNQYIMQRALGASSLAQGQRGIVFASFLKLIIPFIVCIPGIIAFPLYCDKMQQNAMNDPQLNAPLLAEFQRLKDHPAEAKILFPLNAQFAELHPALAAEIVGYNSAVLRAATPATAPVTAEQLLARNDALIAQARASSAGFQVRQMLIGYDYDSAFPLLVRHLTPIGLRGFVVAALLGAVISSLASMLNAASTIFTMDLFREYVVPQASQRTLVWVGRACVPVCVVIGCLIAPRLADPKFQGAFAYIQEFQGFVSPGVLTIFLFGLFVPRAPRVSGLLGLVLSPIIYGLLYVFFNDMAFLNRMAITVGAIAVVLTLLTLLAPLQEPIVLPRQSRIALESSRGSLISGLLVVALTAILYIVFW